MSSINSTNSSHTLKDESPIAAVENSSLALRWLSAIIVPLIVLATVYNSFRYIYNFFFARMDQSYILGFILWLPVTTLSALITLYVLLPRFKLGITLASCVTVFIVNTASFIGNINYWTGYCLKESVQQILSNIIIFFIAIYLPIYLYKRKKNSNNTTEF